jgi:site-specific recombinase XerD
MARTPKFNWKEIEKGKWQVDVPPSVSETGKRERHFFTTRDKAKAHAQTLREKFLAHGGQAGAIKPSLAEAAVAAEAILAPWGASLVDAAKHYAEEMERLGASKSVADAAADWILSCEGGLRDRTLGGYKQTQKRLAAIGGKLLANVTAEHLQTAVCPLGSTGAAAAGHYRNARAFWKWSAKKGWCRADVFSRVEAPRVKKDGEIAILTPAEAESLLRVAEAHYPQAVASYALQLFAGIRAEELARLEAGNVTADGIELSASVTKKGRRRHITPSATLKAWLAKHPFEPCPNWRRVDMACRRLAGWAVESELLNEKVASGELKKLPKTSRGSWPQNVLRHSHASYAVAAGTPLETLLFEFGHTGSANVLRAHYVGRASKKAALEFFAIRPEGAEAEAAPQLETVEEVA